MKEQTAEERILEEVLDPDSWTETKSINFLCHDCRTLHGRLTTLTTGLADREAAEAYAGERGWRREHNVWRCMPCAMKSEDDDKAEAQYLS